MKLENVITLLVVLLYSKLQTIIILILILFCCLGTVSAQKILLLGTAHNFKANMNQDFKAVQNNIVKFKPQLFCTEAIPAWDTISTKNVLKKQVAEIYRIKKAQGLTPQMVNDSLQYYSAIKPTSTSNVLKLAFYHYLNNDIGGNAAYNWFAAKIEAEKTNTQLTDTLATRWSKKDQFSEYSNVVFPAALQLNIKQIFGIDDRTDSPADVIAQGKAQAKIATSANGAKFIADYTKITQNYTQYEKEGKAFTLLNDSTYQNKVSSLITSAPDFTTDESAKTVKELWEKRNLSIAKRLINVLKENKKAKRIMVSFGAAHIPLLKKYIKELCPKCEILTYQEFLSANSK